MELSLCWFPNLLACPILIVRVKRAGPDQFDSKLHVSPARRFEKVEGEGTHRTRNLGREAAVQPLFKLILESHVQ